MAYEELKTLSDEQIERMSKEEVLAFIRRYAGRASYRQREALKHYRNNPEEIISSIYSETSKWRDYEFSPKDLPNNVRSYKKLAKDIRTFLSYETATAKGFEQYRIRTFNRFVEKFNVDTGKKEDKKTKRRVYSDEQYKQFWYTYNKIFGVKNQSTPLITGYTSEQVQSLIYSMNIEDKMSFDDIIEFFEKNKEEEYIQDYREMEFDEEAESVGTNKLGGFGMK